MIKPSHYCVSHKVIVDLPQLGGSFYDQALRPNEVPSMFVAGTTVPTEVLNSLSARSGNLGIANLQAIHIARTECDRSFFCECPRCTSGRGLFIQALSHRAPLVPPPRFPTRISRSIPEDHAISINDRPLSPSSRIHDVPTLSHPDQLALVSPKSGPPPPPSTRSTPRLDLSGSSYAASHISDDTWADVGTSRNDEDWCRASEGVGEDPLILGINTDHFDLRSEQSVDSFASWYI